MSRVHGYYHVGHEECRLGDLVVFVGPGRGDLPVDPEEWGSIGLVVKNERTAGLFAGMFIHVQLSTGRLARWPSYWLELVSRAP